jgi:glycosyltransferase involved in cell wall biosynthesis
MKVTILDMQPIEPATGGGRLRMLGLYHALGNEICATYVGTYDWPGPGYRRHMLSPTLEEIDIPLTEAHFRASYVARERAGGRVVIDCVFHNQAHLSPEYVAQARASTREADVVVFSHPWIYPLVREVLDPERQLIVYDSHNVEGVLRTQLLDDGAGGSKVARGVAEVENALCQAADLVLTCSQWDRLQFARIYEVPIQRIKLIPNGVFTTRIKPADTTEKRAARARQALPKGPIAIFLGSNYGPNIEAALFIARELAPRLPMITFLIAGSVGEALRAELNSNLPSNLRATGSIDEATKSDLLTASDVAINPMFSGSGTNIKMFDFMAAGLPVVTTPVGARGIETGEPAFLIQEKGAFADALRELVSNEDQRARLSEVARTETERHYSWEQISPTLGLLLQHHHRRKSIGGKSPYFSVITPTFERPAMLTRLLDRLAMQTERDFEVIVVDQSEQSWHGTDLKFDIDLLYVRSQIRGAVNARNLGATLAGGEVFAFIDDDCEPAPRWLEAGRHLFAQPDVVGVEGLIESDRLDDPNWRTVTNKGFSGLGFMTANLFVRSCAFNQLNGFDVAFENPHFREDTDFGWRLQQLGYVPFSDDAWVFHPPHRRDIARESNVSRDAYFEKDALLLRKHPERYRDLFFAEAHWKNTPGFWPNFLLGIAKYKVELPEYIYECSPGAEKCAWKSREGC